MVLVGEAEVGVDVHVESEEGLEAVQELHQGIAAFLFGEQIVCRDVREESLHSLLLHNIYPNKVIREYQTRILANHLHENAHLLRRLHSFLCFAEISDLARLRVQYLHEVQRVELAVFGLLHIECADREAASEDALVVLEAEDRLSLSVIGTDQLF